MKTNLNVEQLESREVPSGWNINEWFSRPPPANRPPPLVTPHPGGWNINQWFSNPPPVGVTLPPWDSWPKPIR